MAKRTARGNDQRLPIVKISRATRDELDAVVRIARERGDEGATLSGLVRRALSESLARWRNEREVT